MPRRAFSARLRMDAVRAGRIRRDFFGAPGYPAQGWRANATVANVAVKAAYPGSARPRVPFGSALPGQHRSALPSHVLAIWRGADQLRHDPDATRPQQVMPTMPDSLPVRWTPDRRPQPGSQPGPAMRIALWRGVRGRCPLCGTGRLFAGWLRVREVCAVCAAPLGLIRADDAPPYFTVFIVAHVVIGAQVALERVALLSVAAEMMIFLPGTLALVLLLIRPVKGATVGLMWKLGFMRKEDSDAGSL